MEKGAASGGFRDYTSVLLPAVLGDNGAADRMAGDLATLAEKAEGQGAAPNDGKRRPKDGGCGNAESWWRSEG
ncbi:hypothetical protein E2562_017877 [Oryza meyeriana var. granulata]|uniref:Uncharacterized protein n=1 Tax=Oryza meyeriana var. granulata TaxID=110450 RepID=A0A6G1E0F3_9ORYZ|nr:hypothetical protein E2562_017877 [Oryza meyeriana var. granulata]